MKRQDSRLSPEQMEALFRDTAPVTENGFRHYAVLIPLVMQEDGLHVLYELRAKDLDRQPGEICFPGGQQERGESLEACALRETREEIGITEDYVDIWCELTTIYGAGKFAMHCFLGLIQPEALETLQLSEAEVDRVFTVPLQDLLETEPERYTSRLIQKGPEDFPYERVTGENSYPWRVTSAPVPVYAVHGWNIWGLTGRATDLLVQETKKRLQEV